MDNQSMDNQSHDEYQLIKRPLNVMQACILQLVSAILTVVTTIGGYEHYVEVSKLFGKDPGSEGQFLVSRAISIIIAILFAYFFSKGKNWARIVYIVFFIVTLGMMAIGLSVTGKIFLDHITELDTIINLIQILISVIVCCLLLTSESREWFKSMKEDDKK